MKKTWFAFTAVLAGGLAAAPAHAQVFTPSYMSPYVENDLGIYLSDGPGDLAVEGIWRRGAGGHDFGIRAGFADVGDGALMVGIEVRNPVVLAGAPIGLAFTASGQGVLGDITLIGGAIGFSAGHRFVPQGANFSLTPYIHPRLALLTGDLPGDDDLETEVQADIGIDLGWRSGITLRFSAGLGSEQADWGIGLSWRQ